jgi:phage gp36-like protein
VYVSPAELRDALGAVELSQLATPQGRIELTADKLNAAIAGTLPNTDADYTDAVAAVATITEKLTFRAAYVDGFLGAYSPLPIADAEVPDLIKQIVVALTRFDLAGAAPPATVTKRYDDARKDLKDISDGVIVLPLATSAATQQTGGAADAYGPAPIYSRETTVRFQSPCGRFP